MLTMVSLVAVRLVSLETLDSTCPAVLPIQTTRVNHHPAMSRVTVCASLIARGVSQMSVGHTAHPGSRPTTISQWIFRCSFLWKRLHLPSS
uniref:Secreted protein n=1 Tax=Hordeum vulgare subsp. vulgare TaxID=112509 RepID=A0A8I6XK62_HORVV